MTDDFIATLPGMASAAADEAARAGRLSVAELLDHLQHALVVIDAQGHIIGYNASALTLLELPEDLMARGPLIDEVVRWQAARGDLKGDPERLLRRVWHHLRATQTSGQPHVYSYTTASGRTLQGSTIALPGGGWVRIYTDVSKHAQALAALRDSEARFRSLTELSADWYWEWDTEGRYTRLEGRVVRERDIAPLFIGRRPWDVPAPNRPRPEDWRPLLDAVERREPFRRFEVQHVLPDGRTYYWFALSGEPVFDAHGTFVGYRGIGRDVTARNRPRRPSSAWRTTTV